MTMGMMEGRGERDRKHYGAAAPHGPNFLKNVIHKIFLLIDIAELFYDTEASKWIVIIVHIFHNRCSGKPLIT